MPLFLLCFRLQTSSKKSRLMVCKKGMLFLCILLIGWLRCESVISPFCHADCLFCYCPFLLCFKLQTSSKKSQIVSIQSSWDINQCLQNWALSQKERFFHVTQKDIFFSLLHTQRMHLKSLISYHCLIIVSHNIFQWVSQIIERFTLKAWSCVSNKSS